MVLKQLQMVMQMMLMEMIVDGDGDTLTITNFAAGSTEGTGTTFAAGSEITGTMVH